MIHHMTLLLSCMIRSCRTLKCPDKIVLDQANGQSVAFCMTSALNQYDTPHDAAPIRRDKVPWEGSTTSSTWSFLYKCKGEKNISKIQRFLGVMGEKSELSRKKTRTNRQTDRIAKHVITNTMKVRFSIFWLALFWKISLKINKHFLYCNWPIYN